MTNEIIYRFNLTYISHCEMCNAMLSVSVLRDWYLGDKPIILLKCQVQNLFSCIFLQRMLVILPRAPSITYTSYIASCDSNSGHTHGTTTTVYIPLRCRLLSLSFRTGQWELWHGANILSHHPWSPWCLPVSSETLMRAGQVLEQRRLPSCGRN